jgi:Fe2+ transport system protein FeoA
MKLSELKPGQLAVIVSVNQSSYGLRIMELGLVPGSFITMKSKAPMGDPIIFSVGDSKISIRKSEADNVLIAINS